MLNTRVTVAKTQARWIALGAVSVLLLVTLATALSNKRPSTPSAVNNCAGYAGQPTLSYLHSKQDRLQAATECRHRIPKLSISVKYRNYVSLQKSRLQAVKEGVLNTDGNDFVPAQFAFEGKSLSGKLRLKGDWAVHLQKNKSWSLRVLLAGESEILGRRQFSLQVPEVRNYDVEFLYLQQLQQAGLMPVRMQLVEVEFNGEPWGLMELEDHFSLELMEVQKRKATIIGRFDESDMWTHLSRYGDLGIYDSVYINEFLAFDKAKIAKSEALAHYELIASSMMAAWQEGRLPLYQIFDLEAFARFIAITEAWGGWHALRWHNLRFYLNPYTLLFEPVPFDNSMALVDISKHVAELLVAPNSNAHSINMSPLSELFDSPNLINLLKAEVLKLNRELVASDNYRELQSEQNYLKSAFDAHGMPTIVNLGLLKRNYEFLQSDFDQYVRKRDKPKPEPTPDNPEKRQYTSMVRLHVYDNGTISLANKLPFEIIVHDMQAISPYGVKQALREKVAIPARLAATPLRGRPEIVSLQVSDLDPEAVVELTVENPNTGQVQKVRQERRLLFLDEASYSATSPILGPPITPPEWLVKNDNQWLIPAGAWSVSQPLVVPEGVALTIQAGAHLSMAPDTFILARGALNILGDESSPVTVEGQSGELWGGIYVINAAEESVWRSAVIRDLRPFSLGGFRLTGVTNFYRSDLSLQDVVIEHVEGEDAINMIESKYSFSGLSIKDTTSDGLDSDFSTGRIERSNFSKIGGDAIDTSGSHVEISRVNLSSIRDKAVSAGEASTVTVSDLDIDSVGVGVAAKDYSSVKVDNVRIKNAALSAIMAYSKKPEFGGAHIEVSNIQFDQGSDIAISQTGSTVIIDNETIKPKNVNVEYLYSEGLMKK